MGSSPWFEETNRYEGQGTERFGSSHRRRNRLRGIHTARCQNRGKEGGVESMGGKKISRVFYSRDGYAGSKIDN